MKDKKSKKYQDIVGTAHGLFWKHGIKRVSIEEICKEAGVSKMTFYKFFSNKIELAKEIVKNIFDETEIKYRQLMSEDISFEEKIRKQVAAKFEGTKDMSTELVKDIYTGTIPGLKEYWDERTVKFTREVMDGFAYAQKMGWMRKDINLNFILYFNGKMAELIYDKNLQGMYNTTRDLVMEITNLFFYGIFPRKNEKHE